MIVDKSVVVDNNCRKALLHQYNDYLCSDILKLFEQIVLGRVTRSSSKNIDLN